MSTTTAQPQRINKTDFIARVAARCGHSPKVVAVTYDALIAELTRAVGDDDIVVLTGFGRFYRHEHKGHKVRFGKSEIDDYSVLKFSASRSLNRRLDAIGQENVARVDDGQPEPVSEQESAAVPV